MLLSIPNSRFEEAEQRRYFAEYISGVVQRGAHHRFEPYCPDPTDDRCFVVDSANNWRVSFPEEDPSIVDISCRYQVQGEEALARWLAFFAQAKILMINADMTQHERHRTR